MMRFICMYYTSTNSFPKHSNSTVTIWYMLFYCVHPILPQDEHSKKIYFSILSTKGLEFG